MKSIEELRNKLDKIDQEVLELICARVEMVKRIGEVKKKNGGEIVDLERETQIIKNLMIEAKKNDLDPELVKNIWKLLFEYSYQLEK